MTPTEQSALKQAKARQSSHALLWLAGMLMLLGTVTSPMAIWFFFALAAFLALLALMYQPRSMAALIILILAAVVAVGSFPQYIDSGYFQRQRVAIGLKSAANAQRMVAAYYARTGQWPENNAAAGLPLPAQLGNQYLNEISVQQGVVRIRFKRVKTDGPRPHSGAMLTLRPAVSDGKFAGWVCGHAPIPSGTQLKGDDDTDVMQEYLPRECSQ